MRLRKQIVSSLTLLLLLCGTAWAAKVEPMSLEQRKAVMNLPGMCSIKPATRWDSGIVTGNGVMGASVLGQPYKERVVLNHERLFRPFLDKRPLPPIISGALPEVRRLMKEGKNCQALEYWRKVMAENGHPKIINTPPYHPAYTMQNQRKDAGDISHYLRTVDFMSGEAMVRYNNAEGKNPSNRAPLDAYAKTENQDTVERGQRNDLPGGQGFASLIPWSVKKATFIHQRIDAPLALRRSALHPLKRVSGCSPRSVVVVLNKTGAQACA